MPAGQGVRWEMMLAAACLTRRRLAVQDDRPFVTGSLDVACQSKDRSGPAVMQTDRAVSQDSGLRQGPGRGGQSLGEQAQAAAE
jgi:hypothetical protein